MESVSLDFCVRAQHLAFHSVTFGNDASRFEIDQGFRLNDDGYSADRTLSPNYFYRIARNNYRTMHNTGLDFHLKFPVVANVKKFLPIFQT